MPPARSDEDDFLLGHQGGEHAQHIRHAERAEQRLERHARRAVLLRRGQPKGGDHLAVDQRLDHERAARWRERRVVRSGHEGGHKLVRLVVELQDVQHVHEQREPRPLGQHAQADGKGLAFLCQAAREAEHAAAIVLGQGEGERLGVHRYERDIFHVWKAELSYRLCCRGFGVTEGEPEGGRDPGGGPGAGLLQSNHEEVFEQRLLLSHAQPVPRAATHQAPVDAATRNWLDACWGSGNG